MRLWSAKRGVLLDDLMDDQRCFRECVTRDAVMRKIKRIRQKIDARVELGVTIEVSKDRVTLNKPGK